MALEIIEPTVKAGAHVRRVTLQLLRHAVCCPDDLREIIERLAAADWDMAALSRAEAEAIFGEVGDDLAQTAKCEYAVDTSTIIDHRASDAYCKLCGHKHTRWEFLLRNTREAEGGKDHWTGSTCIVQYGLNVDGEGTAEAALEALNKAINSAKKKANRDDWRAEHPDHEDEMARLQKGLDRADKRVPWGMFRKLRPKYQQRVKAFGTPARAALKYYRANGFLTNHRTAQVYVGGLLEQADGLVQEWDEAEDGTAAGRARKVWDRFKAEYPRMNEYQARQVRWWKERGWTPADLFGRNLDLLNEIIDQHKAAPPDAGPDDTSDLPF
tara:strand:+ start:2047 stop:3024 length:978 start_codon:yes stop_codon:yes gene_type:complete